MSASPGCCSSATTSTRRARSNWTSASSSAKHNGLPQNAYRWRVVTARLREAEGDLDEALALLDEADRVYDGDFAPNVQPVPGDPGPAAAAARRAGRRARSGPRDRQLTAARRALVPARVRTPHAGAAADRPAPGEPGGRATPTTPSVCSTGCSQRPRRAAAGPASSKRSCCRPSLTKPQETAPAALAALHRAVTLAEPEGFVRALRRRGPTDGGAAQGAARSSRTRRPTVNRLLAAIDANADGRRRPQPLVDPLSERELDVLRLLGGDLGGPDIARHLSVSLNTRAHAHEEHLRQARRDQPPRGRPPSAANSTSSRKRIHHRIHHMW